MNPITYEQMQELCGYIYVGLSLKEAAVMLNLDSVTLHKVVTDPGILKLVCYAQTKAKKDLLAKINGIIKEDQKIPYSTLQLITHTLSSRFGYSLNRFELKQKQKHHQENLAHKRSVLQQWADVHATRFVIGASHEELETFQKI